MLRYSLLRLLIFFACLAALWLAGLRDRNEQPWLVVGAALLSMIISFFVLRPFRDDAVRSIEKRQSARLQRKASQREEQRAQQSDEAAEDESFR